jgi:hypothetical protein
MKRDTSGTIVIGALGNLAVIAIIISSAGYHA